MLNSPNLFSPLFTPLMFPLAMGRGVVSGGVVPDADATAYVARMTVAPSAEQASIYDYFAKQAKAIGVWPYIKDCGFLGAADVQSSKLGFKNVINPTAISTPTLDAGYGSRGDGTTSKFNTGYSFPADQQNDASFGIYSLSRNQEDAVVIGNSNSALALRALTGTPDNQACRIVGSSAGTRLDPDPIGFFLANRLGPLAADGKLWKNGAIAIASTGPSAVPSVDPFHIGGRNAQTQEYSSRSVAFWHFGRGIPEALISGYSDLVAEVCAMLSASYTVLANPTKKTKSLYRYLIRMGRQPKYLLGAFDNTFWGLGQTPNLIADIATLTGKAPAVMTMEWVDPNGANGAVDSAAQLQRIKDHYAAGGIVSLHHHPGNPVTGTFWQTPSPQSPPTAGNQYDKSGSPIIACLSGGSKRADFLAYCDRLIAFLQLCVDANGEPIPIILRWWHEVNGDWFWWTDSTNKANSVQLVKDFVDRMKASGLRSVLFDNNQDIGTATVASAYYPGDAYSDIISADYYDAGASGSVSGLSSAVTPFGSLTGLSRRKPRWFAEMGYQNAAQSQASIWTTATGYYHRDRFSSSIGFAPWRSTFGPAVGMNNAADFQSMVTEANCITRDRLAGVYTDAKAMAA